MVSYAVLYNVVLTWMRYVGDIYMIRVLKQNIIVINSEKIARELLDRRSRIYSDRPYLATRIPCVVVLLF